MGINTVILEPSMVAAKLLFHADYRLVGAGIGIRRFALGVQRDLGIEVNRTFGPEPDSVPGQCYMTGITAIEILIGNFGDPAADAIAQGFADIKIFTGNTKGHETSVENAPPVNLNWVSGLKVSTQPSGL
jgi:hypothetical protein